MTTQDPIAALRAVLAANAKIPHLEAEIANLRKHNASAELEAIRAALAESPVPNAPADCDLAGWVRYLLRGWRSERKEASELAQLCQEAHNALTSVGAPEGGTPAVRIFHLEVSHQRRISELEAKVRALTAERNEGTSWNPPRCPQCGCGMSTEELSARCLECDWHGKLIKTDNGVNVAIMPDYLTPGASELACPQCGCVVYWQMHEVHDGAEGSAHCSRSSYTARAPSMPMVGDGGCEWHGRVRRVGGRVEVVT